MGLEVAENSPTRGLRYNKGKNRMGLLPRFALEQIGHIMTRGAEKYLPHNWEKGMPWSEVLDSLERHLAAYKRGDDFDLETGKLHIAHVAVNASFITEYYKVFPEGDDRLLPTFRHRRIGLDVDDVLADFVPAYCERFDLPIPNSWFFDRGFKEHYAELVQDKDFWMGLKPKCDPNTIPFEPVCYITSRGCPIEWTVEWLDANGFPRVPVIQVGVGNSKVDVAKEQKLDTFVDDYFDTVRDLSEAGIFTYLLDMPHNKRYNVGHRRIKNLTDMFMGGEV